MAKDLGRGRRLAGIVLGLIVCAVLSVGGLFAIGAAAGEHASRPKSSDGHDDELRKANRAIQFDRKNATAYLLRGTIYMLRDEYDKAIPDFDRVLALAGPHATALAQRGYAFYRKGDVDRAMRDYDAALALDPHLVLALNARAIAYSGKRDLPRALSDLARVITADPKREAQYRNKMCWDTATLGGDLHTALEHCERALTLKPLFAAALDSRGLVYLKMKQLDKARADFEAALKEKKQPSSLFCLGVVKRKTGDIAGGDRDIAAAKAMDARIAQTYAAYGVMP